ncbi:MAG: ACT domain-containing protein, partial [Pseudomonadota bacterium]
TASAIVGDVIDIGRGGVRPTFGVPASDLSSAAQRPEDSLASAYYLRLTVIDKPGVLAQVTKVLGDAAVSIDQMRQIGRQPDAATVLVVTHEAAHGQVRDAVDQISRLDVSLAEPIALTIERA